MVRSAAVCALGAVCLAAVASCGAPSGGGAATILIGLNVPATADPYVAQYITRGAQLAVDEANQQGVAITGTTYKVALKTYDDTGQPQQSASNVDAAIHDGAVAVIEDGLGATISASHSTAAGIPEIVIDNGDASLMDPQNRPSLFRLGIANDAAAGILGTYISGMTGSVAIIHDDTESGRDGANQLTSALATAGATAAPVVEVAAASPTVDAQIAQVDGSHPGAIALWGGDTFVGRLASAMHAAGVSIPLFAGPQGESPAVRAVAGAAGSEGLRLVTSRMTSETDPVSFGQFEHRLAATEGGPTDAGFKDAAGQEIRQPNDRDLLAYDAVNLVIAALRKQGSTTQGPALITALGSVSVTSANGDHRGFNPQNHEGVSSDDMYIAVIHDMQFEPVKDEKLSASLPSEDEILADFH